METHDHSSHLQHHFVDSKQQYDASSLGMWLFLVTEVLFFSGLFAVYAIYRSMYPTGFATASHHLNIQLGAINTVVLIASSFTMVMAVHSAKFSHQNALVRYLISTLGLGIVFLVIKAFEYSHKFHEHLVPGNSFFFPDFTGPGSELFFSCYFAMTGLHALHMIIGMGLLVYFIYKSKQHQYNEKYYTPIDMMGLYWHFVDIVWIFLFPLLYLLGRH